MTPTPTFARTAIAAVAVATVSTLASGGLHLLEVLDTYSNLPLSIPGAWVVRIGFPIHTAGAVLIALALVVSLGLRRRLTVAVAGAALAFQAGALAVLVATRYATVFGWTEPIWTPVAQQTAATEIVAIVALMVLLVVSTRRPTPQPIVRNIEIADLALPTWMTEEPEAGRELASVDS